MDPLSLIPEFGGVLTTVFAFVIALSIIVAVHEYGHYIVGRWSGIHAEVFSLGFGPVLFARTDRRGTRWQVAALPFGGYVKFLGDGDAASSPDKQMLLNLDSERKRHTMHGAPLWARTATVAAGPVFNFVLAILIFTAVVMTRGEVAEPLTVGELRPMPGAVQELRPGDRILSIGGQQTPDFADADAFEAFSDGIPLAPVVDYGIERDGAAMTVRAPYPYPAMVTRLAPRSAAMDVEMKIGDVITGVDGDPIFAFDQLKDRVEGSDGRVLLIDVWRDGEMLEFALAPRRVDEPQEDNSFVTHWRIGIVGGLMFEPATAALGLGDAVSAAGAQTWRIMTGSLSGLYHMVTGAISSCNLSGPIGIAQTSGAMASQGAESFIWFVAVLSVAVGMLNLFPIPVLDGGHLVFYAYEAVTGKPPSDKALRFLMALGLGLILTLMLFAVTNDLFCP